MRKYLIGVLFFCFALTGQGNAENCAKISDPEAQKRCVEENGCVMTCHFDFVTYKFTDKTSTACLACNKSEAAKRRAGAKKAEYCADKCGTPGQYYAWMLTKEVNPNCAVCPPPKTEEDAKEDVKAKLQKDPKAFREYCVSNCGTPQAYDFADRWDQSQPTCRDLQCPDPRRAEREKEKKKGNEDPQYCSWYCREDNFNEKNHKLNAECLERKCPVHKIGSEEACEQKAGIDRILCKTQRTFGLKNEMENQLEKAEPPTQQMEAQKDTLEKKRSELQNKVKSLEAKVKQTGQENAARSLNSAQQMLGSLEDMLGQMSQGFQRTASQVAGKVEPWWKGTLDSVKEAQKAGIGGFFSSFGEGARVIPAKCKGLEGKQQSECIKEVLAVSKWDPRRAVGAGDVIESPRSVTSFVNPAGMTRDVKGSLEIGGCSAQEKANRVDCGDKLVAGQVHITTPKVDKIKRLRHFSRENIKGQIDDGAARQAGAELFDGAGMTAGVNDKIVVVTGEIQTEDPEYVTFVAKDGMTTILVLQGFVRFMPKIEKKKQKGGEESEPKEEIEPILIRAGEMLKVRPGQPPPPLKVSKVNLKKVKRWWEGKEAKKPQERPSSQQD